MALLAVLFAIAAGVWMIPLVHRGAVLVIGSVVLTVGTVFGPAFFSIDGPIQISLDRILWLGLMGVVVLQWRTGDVRFPQLGRVDFAVIAFAVWLLVSCKRGGPVPDGSSPLARWIFFIAVPVSMYFAARMTLDRDRALRFFNVSLLWLGVYLAITAVLEVRGFHSLVFPRFISDPEFVEFYGRGRGPLLNPAGNGIVLTMSLVVAAVRFFEGGRLGKVVYAGIGLVLAAGIYATLTRSVWLGAAAALGVLALIYTPRWFRVLGLVAVVGLGGVMTTGLKDEILSLKRDKNLSAADAAKSVSLRPLLALVAFEMFKTHPIAGHGYGHYKEHAPVYHTVRDYDLPLEQARPYIQHNVWLSILVDTGLVGLSLMLALFAIFGIFGWKLAAVSTATSAERELGMVAMGLLVAYVINGLFHEVSIIEMIHMYLFFTAGLLVSAMMRNDAPEPAEPERAVRTPRELAV